MNRFLSFGTLATVALLFLAGASQTPAVPAAAAPLQPLEISIEIAPAYYGPYELLRQRFTETFTCTARLTDPGTNKVAGIAEVKVTPGNEATKSVTQGDLTITLMAKIGSERTGATTDLTVMRNGQLVTHQKSALLLTRTFGRLLN
jgi:hypothetical protein